MKKLHFGTGFTAFIIFFGIAVLDSFTSRNIWWIAFWVLMGILFFIADNMRKRPQ